MKRKSELSVLMALLLLVAVIFISSGCSAKESNNLTSVSNDLTATVNTEASTESPKNVMTVSSRADLLYDISDNNVLAEISDCIALIKIDEITGVDNKNRLTGDYISTSYTYGKARVLRVFKGDIGTTEIGFVRDGGILPYNEWIKGQVDPDKLIRMRREAGISDSETDNMVVNYMPQGDISIESGKTYLVYMFRNPDFNLENEYTIQGYQYGLRELRQTNTSTQSTSEMYVKNNTTGEWEALTGILPAETK